ncbi:Lactococcin-G-processing and transport ATP-binding protein LagD [Seminavis robusta]|uniref:Lactococcin-G-processing and transport ATP-binding protein LagD n=1 Tax=Seminavis robusta TaxID=568900 RepID=A0A9N8EFH4_9STRA|nr:Lactococcin-G-processing and transport ATP-binding protein LagD [Seminavis robusta]|eukprot:Sro1117_g242960.1 Lactococcin-G-processing and transport ATP-binding protein LagD (1414) ;mRNA; r:5563-10146
MSSEQPKNDPKEVDVDTIGRSGARSSVTHSRIQIGGGAPRRASNATAGTGTKKKPHSSYIPHEFSEEFVRRTSGLQATLPVLSANTTANFVSWCQERFGKTKFKSEPEQPSRVSFLALLSYSTFGERIWMVIGLFFALLTGLCLPTWLILLARALDTFSTIAHLILQGAGDAAYEHLNRELGKLVIAFAILGAISLVVGFTYVAIWTYTGERQALRIKEKFVHAALRQDAEWFDVNNRDELPTSIANAMIHIQGAIGRPMADLFANAVSAFASLLVALLLNAPLAIVMLCVVPVVAIVIMIVSCFSRKANQQGANSFVAAGALATEAISGIKTLASLCAEKWALTAYTGHIAAAQKHSIYGGYLAGLMSGITGMLFYCTYSGAFYIGTEQVAAHMTLTIIVQCLFFEDAPDEVNDDGLYGIAKDVLEEINGEVDCRVNGASVMCCIYGVILCATFFGLMAPGLQNINLGRQAAATIFATINRIPVIDADSTLGDTPKKMQGKITFQRVFFSYPTQPNRAIFHNFNLTIQAGESVAFVGPSGSGKSTIAKLLLRFYCPLGGNIVLDDEYPLGSLRLSWWREQVGYVAQSPILFPGTIRYNIACGKEGATEEEVIEAAKAACAHEFITELPQGYDTFYSGASVQLSGGQMQRICIARAMIRKPSILLLDEATSALDTNSERQVQDALAHIRSQKKMTTLSVAHRLSTIVHCDQIAVISGGNIAELGNHQQLFALDGIYTTLCESQGITAESTFESTPRTVTSSTSRDDVEVSVNGVQAPNIENIENGLTLSQKEVLYEDEEDEQLEGLTASPMRILALNSSESGYMLMGVIGAMMVGTLAPAEGIITARIVENFYTQKPEDMVEANSENILYFLILAAGALVGNIISGIGFSVSGYRLSGKMRTLVFEAILRRNIGWFDVPEHSVGELTSRLEADAEEVAKITGWALGYKVRMISSLVAGITIALVFSWRIGLAAIACIPIIMASSFVQVYCIRRQIAAAQEGLSPESIFENGLRGIEAVQSYGLQVKVGEDYSKALIPQSKRHARMGLTSGLAFGLSQFAMFGSFAIIFFVGAQLLVAGKVGFVEFFTPILSIMFGTVGVSQVNADFNAQQDGLRAAQRIFDIVDEPLDEMDPFGTDGVQPDSLNGAITYKDVSFAYPTRQNHPIYYASEGRSGFSLEIAQKNSVAFVGKSGSGKSTALQILLRFYNITDGEVSLDGVDLSKINISWLRHQIGYVGQNPTLFAGTIRDNILLGKPDATEAEIETAAKAAAAHEFILDQTDGYDTDIGSGGSLLSGGQRQRIAIARAIVSDPKMLVLDEATAALDNESEKIVQAALDNLQKIQPRTTLVVAHRLTTVKDCDKIAVLGNGGVIELGSHGELLASKGLYNELWQKQGAADADDDEPTNVMKASVLSV